MFVSLIKNFIFYTCCMFMSKLLLSFSVKTASLLFVDGSLFHPLHRRPLRKRSFNQKHFLENKLSLKNFRTLWTFPSSSIYSYEPRTVSPPTYLNLPTSLCFDPSDVSMLNSKNWLNHITVKINCIVQAPYSKLYPLSALWMISCLIISGFVFLSSIGNACVMQMIKASTAITFIFIYFNWLLNKATNKRRKKNRSRCDAVKS